MYIKSLDFRAGPGRAAEEGEARFDAGIVQEAANGHAAPQFLPAKLRDELVQESLEGHAMERIGHAGEFNAARAKRSGEFACVEGTIAFSPPPCS